MRQHLRHGLGQRGARRERDLLLVGGLLLAEDRLLRDRRLRHEGVVEVEGDGESHGRRPGGQGQRGQLGNIGRLDPEGGPVVEADVGQGGDVRDREIALQRLRGRGTPRLVVGVDLGFRRRADRVAVGGDRVIDVAPEQGGDGVVVQGVADERVGESVLDGAQVDVGERRLRHGGDGAGHAGQVVGQGRVDRHVVATGAVTLLHQPQPPVPLRLVERDEVHVRRDVLMPQHVDPRGIESSLLLLVDTGLGGRRRVVIQLILKKRHGGRQNLVILGNIADISVFESREFEAIDTR